MNSHLVSSPSRQIALTTSLSRRPLCLIARSRPWNDAGRLRALPEHAPPVRGLLERQGVDAARKVPRPLPLLQRRHPGHRRHGARRRCAAAFGALSPSLSLSLTRGADQKQTRIGARSLEQQPRLPQTWLPLTSPHAAAALVWPRACAVLGALRMQRKPPEAIKELRVVVVGAGSAGMGVAQALQGAMVEEGQRGQDKAALHTHGETGPGV